MFGLGFSEIVLILIVALVVIGPKGLPEAARTLGKTLGVFKRSLDEVKFEINSTLHDSPKSTTTSTQQLSVTTLSATTPKISEQIDEQAEDQKAKVNAQ